MVLLIVFQNENLQEYVLISVLKNKDVNDFTFRGLRLFMFCHNYFETYGNKWRSKFLNQ